MLTASCATPRLPASSLPNRCVGRGYRCFHAYYVTPLPLLQAEQECICLDRSEGGWTPGIADRHVRNPLEPHIEYSGPMFGEGMTIIDASMPITSSPPYHQAKG